MCLAVYIGTNHKQPVSKFIDNETYIYLEELAEPREIDQLRKKFSKDFIYYVGSYQGCSCGFIYDPQEEWKEDEKEDEIKTLQSNKSLLALICDLTLIEDLEFYSCWEGDWSDAIEVSSEIDTKTICSNNNFEFSEKQFIVFKKYM